MVANPLRGARRQPAGGQTFELSGNVGSDRHRLTHTEPPRELYPQGLVQLRAQI